MRNTSARQLLQGVILQQRAATEELKETTRELETTLEQFLATYAELRTAAASAVSEAPQTGASAEPTRKPVPDDVSMPELKRRADLALKKGREAVRESMRVRLRSSRVRAALKSAGGAPSSKHSAKSEASSALSHRERQVLTLIVEGKSSKEIAAELGISFRTAVTHRASIMGKLDVHEIASVVREAIRRGLV